MTFRDLQMATPSNSFVSLFSGCGGFDIGFLSSGFVPRAAFDIDDAAVANYQANIGQHVHKTDLRNGIPGDSNSHGADVVIAGPPCQGFSTAGKRRIDDERNHLLTLTGVLALKVRPKVLIVENVAGVIAGDHAKYWIELTDMLRNNGYKTHSISCQASHLGMAQLRKRMLLFAWRTQREVTFQIPQSPSGTLSDALKGIEGLPNHSPRLLSADSTAIQISRRILAGQKLSNVRGGERAVHTWDIPEVFGRTTEAERTLLELVIRLRRQARQREVGDADPVSISRLAKAFGVPFKRLLQSLERKGYIRRSGNHFDLSNTFNGKYRRLSWNAPSCTVDTRFGDPRYFLHPQESRGFTVREAARIQGFPDSYVFHGDEKAQFRLVGNAVPPPVATLAAMFASQLLGRPK